MPTNALWSKIDLIIHYVVRKIQTHRALFGHLFFNIRCVTVHKDEREKRTEQY